jgi:hypothetical protein
MKEKWGNKTLAIFRFLSLLNSKMAVARIILTFFPLSLKTFKKNVVIENSEREKKTQNRKKDAK